MIDPTHAVISIARQCELIQLSRASYYRSANNTLIFETSENLELMRLIDEEYTRHPFTAVDSFVTTYVGKGILLIVNVYNA